MSRRPRQPASPRNNSTVRLIERIKDSRDYYRDLAVRIEAALLGAPVRDDYGDIEHRIERALRKKGCQMPPASDPRRSAGRPRTGSRRRGGR
ncbi:MAG: hypothetical protein OXH52_02185 [Gammaproteobacteria bacterium]|nr:hypothetical protein [Gammaproteobacteria bacterium]